MKSFSIVCRADELLACLSSVETLQGDHSELKKEEAYGFLGVFCENCLSRFWQVLSDGDTVTCEKCGHSELY